MEAQHQILRTLRASESALLATLGALSGKSRTAVSGIVCEKFGFYDARGRPQRAGCMKALRTLEAESRISLPAAQRSLNIARPRLLDAPVAEPVEVPKRVNQLQDLEIVCVRSAQDRAIWNTLMDREHPQGVTTFAGAQLRYLFKSAHGYLGAIGFSASALYLKPRDAWMAWTDAQRSQMLYRVVNLSRFLIRPRVRCKNLASYLLGRVLRRLQADFQARYAYVPYLVETFVGPDQEGTCFRAANFLYLGTTQGRGRHAPVNVCTRSKKKVYVYELARDWREKLGVPHVELHPRLEVGAGLDGAHWAEQEFGGAQLGDRRRSARLVKSATLLAQTMGSPITAAPHWEPAAIRGFYRFIEKADELGITPKKILAPHHQRTIERMRTQETVLCVQDGTDISYSTRPQCDGLEVIGRNQTTAQAQGVHLHATLALSEDGLPLGVLRCAYKKRKGAHAAKTQQWIDGLGDIEAAAQTLPRKTRVLCVMDREADVFAIFAAQRALKRTHVLVRVKVGRRLAEDEARLFKVMRRGPPAHVLELSVARLSLRAKSGRVTHEGRPARHARMEVRFCRVTLPATGDASQDPVRVSAIHIREIAPPEGAQRIEWYLLTTVAVTTLEQALEMVGFYALRWRVEDIFRILKSGCKVEKLRMQQASLLHNTITLHLVKAWRIMLMTLLGRTVGELEVDVLFTDAELEMLRVYSRRYSLVELTNLASAILLVAMMGGYMNRKHDPPPGHTVMWRGYGRLQIRAVAYEELGAFYDLVERPPP